MIQEDGAHMEIGQNVQPAVAKVYDIVIDSVTHHHLDMEPNFVRYVVLSS